MSRVSGSLDNRPIEYFFSILKQEHLRIIKLQDRSFDKIMNWIILNDIPTINDTKEVMTLIELN